MKTLYIIRHAKSSWSHPGLSDFERPLNERGLRDAPFMAALLAQQGVKPDKIVSSPAVRAQTTARFFADALGISADDIQLERSIYDHGEDELHALVQSFDDAWDTVLLFGHNPTLTYFINEFDGYTLQNLSTCGIAHLESQSERWAEWTRAHVRLVQIQIPKDFNIPE
jgi:phosphohistidine phosphatase